MPTPYDGDPLAIEPPGSAPGPGVVPRINLPVDGDMPNASTFEQAFKGLTDHEAWLFNPTSIAGDFPTPLRRYRAPNGHTRALIDHLGFRGGRIVEWSDPLNALAASSDITGRPTLVTSLPAYVSEVYGSGSRWDFWGPFAVHPHCRYNDLKVGNTAGFYSCLYRIAALDLADTNHAAVEWEASCAVYPIAGIRMSFGFGDHTRGHDVVGAWVTDALDTDYFIRFYADDTNSHWVCESREGAGAGNITRVITSVSLDPAWHRFRIEWHGATVAEDGIRAARFYIDGALVATITTHLPYRGGLMLITDDALGIGEKCVNTSGAAPTGFLRMGPRRFGGSLYYASDVY